MAGHLTLTVPLCCMLLLICPGCKQWIGLPGGNIFGPVDESPPHILSVFGPSFTGGVSLGAYTGIPGSTYRFSVHTERGVNTGYDWDFGGAGTPSSTTDTEPMIGLYTPGTFNCVVTVSNPYGSDTMPFTLHVKAPPPPTLLSVETDPRLVAGTANNSFRALSPDNALEPHYGLPASTYAWDFGGGVVPNTWVRSQDGMVVTMGAPGTYHGTVTVTNAAGSDTLEFDYTVTAP